MNLIRYDTRSVACSGGVSMKPRHLIALMRMVLIGFFLLSLILLTPLMTLLLLTYR